MEQEAEELQVRSRLNFLLVWWDGRLRVGALGLRKF